MKERKYHLITIVVVTDKDIPELAQHITGRAYTLDGVDDVHLVTHTQHSAEKFKKE